MAPTSSPVSEARLKKWLLRGLALSLFVGSVYLVMRMTGQGSTSRKSEASISEILISGDARQTSLEGLSAQLDQARQENEQLRSSIGRLASQMSKTIEGVRSTFQRELNGDRNRSDAERQREQQRLDREFSRLQSQLGADGAPNGPQAETPPLPIPRHATSGADPSPQSTLFADEGSTTQGEITEHARDNGSVHPEAATPSIATESSPPAERRSTSGAPPTRRGDLAPPEQRMTGSTPEQHRGADGMEPINLPGADLPDFPELEGQKKPEDQLFTHRAPHMAATATGQSSPGRTGSTGRDTAAAKPLIHIIGSDVPDNTPLPPEADDLYRLPATSILTGTLITGLDASTAQQSKRDPFPILVRLQKSAILPNRYQADIRECFVLMAGYGDLSSERAYLRGETVSCVLNNGKVIETKLEGYATGEDGKAGVRGTLVTKQGQFIARALLVGFLQGAAEVFSKGDSITFGVSQSNNDETNPWASAAMRGTGNALDRIAEFYIDQAYNLFPVIEVSAGREIDIVLTGHVDMPLPNR